MEARYKVQEDAVALDVYLHRKAVKLWERAQQDHSHLDAMVGETWTFEMAPKREYGWMTLTHFAPSSDPAHWPMLYGWLGQKIAQVHELVLPYLREEMQELVPSALASTDDDDSEGPTGIKRQQQRFWRVLSEAISNRNTSLRPKKPLPQHWTSFSIGRSGISISPTLNSRDGRIGVELTISSTAAKKRYYTLLAQRQEVERDFGAPLDWQELPGKHMSRIATWKTDCDPTDESRWPEYVDWMVDAALRMDATFRGRVTALE
jgi:hypothetical protein